MTRQVAPLATRTFPLGAMTASCPSSIVRPSETATSDPARGKKRWARSIPKPTTNNPWAEARSIMLSEPSPSQSSQASSTVLRSMSNSIARLISAKSGRPSVSQSASQESGTRLALSSAAMACAISYPSGIPLPLQSGSQASGTPLLSTSAAPWAMAASSRIPSPSQSSQPSGTPVGIGVQACIRREFIRVGNPVEVAIHGDTGLSGDKRAHDRGHICMKT